MLSVGPLSCHFNLKNRLIPQIFGCQVLDPNLPGSFMEEMPGVFLRKGYICWAVASCTHQLLFGHSFGSLEVLWLLVVDFLSPLV